MTHNVVVAETAYTKSNRRASRVKESDVAFNLDSGNNVPIVGGRIYKGGDGRVHDLDVDDDCQCLESGTSGGGGASNRPIVVHKTSGQSITVKEDETGCLQTGGANVGDKVPSVLLRGPDKTFFRGSGDTVNAIGGSTGRFAGATSPCIGFHRFRRLTPIECERLQGWPDLHTALGLYLSSSLPKSQRSPDKYTLRPVSDTQRYRMTGNGVTADVIREVVLKMVAVGCLK